MNAPAHKVATYTNDVGSGRYLKDPAIIPFTKVPEWLRVKRTWDHGRKEVGADMMVDGPTRNKVRTMHTGLIPTGVEHWYVGDHADIYAGKVCRNTVVFHFTPDARRLIVFYFTGLEKFSIQERVKFAREVIPWLRVPPAYHPTPERDNGGQ
jgi:hypothetical protein